MLLPVDWLKEFVKTDLTDDEISELFYSLGFSIEDVSGGVLNLEITPNRGDAVSVFGLARELCAKLNISTSEYSPPINNASPKSDFVHISSGARENILRYSYIVASGGKICDSDDLIRKRLKEIGLNPKNNIIDLTNYLMHESGQPLHAFDLENIDSFNIEMAKAKDKVDLLGNVKTKLTNECLIAKFGNDIIDLMGISGAQKSSITTQSKRILIQAAVFKPDAIRASSKANKVTTPASYRYERGVDYAMTLPVLEKFSQYLKKWGYQIEEVVDLQIQKHQNNIIDFNADLTNKISGLNIDRQHAIEALQRLGFDIRGDKVTVPSWRTYDILHPEDLVEEILRMIGYENIIPQKLASAPEPPANDLLRNSIRMTLYYRGYIETYSYSFLNNDEINVIAKDAGNVVEVANPLSNNNRYLRPSLLPKLLQAISINQWNDKITLYEIGRVFSQKNESEHVGIISFAKINDIPAGCNMQKIHPESDLARLYKLKKTCYYAEIELDKWPVGQNVQIPINKNQYKPISKYPPAVRDISIIVDDSTDPFEISQYLLSSQSQLLIAEPFDEFKDPKFSGRKSIAIRLVAQNINRSLNDNEVNKLISEILKNLKSHYNAEIRS